MSPEGVAALLVVSVNAAIRRDENRLTSIIHEPPPGSWSHMLALMTPEGRENYERRVNARPRAPVVSRRDARVRFAEPSTEPEAPVEQVATSATPTESTSETAANAGRRKGVHAKDMVSIKTRQIQIDLTNSKQKSAQPRAATAHTPRVSTSQTSRVPTTLPMRPAAGASVGGYATQAGRAATVHAARAPAARMQSQRQPTLGTGRSPASTTPTAPMFATEERARLRTLARNAAAHELLGGETPNARVINARARIGASARSSNLRGIFEPLQTFTPATVRRPGISLAIPGTVRRSDTTVATPSRISIALEVRPRIPITRTYQGSSVPRPAPTRATIIGSGAFRPQTSTAITQGRGSLRLAAVPQRGAINGGTPSFARPTASSLRRSILPPDVPNPARRPGLMGAFDTPVPRTAIRGSAQEGGTHRTQRSESESSAFITSPSEGLSSRSSPNEPFPDVDGGVRRALFARGQVGEASLPIPGSFGEYIAAGPLARSDGDVSDMDDFDLSFQSAEESSRLMLRPWTASNQNANQSIVSNHSNLGSSQVQQEVRYNGNIGTTRPATDLFGHIHARLREELLAEQTLRFNTERYDEEESDEDSR